MAKRGIFITVEGADGSGKTTVCQNLFNHLDALYPGRVVLTREPGGNGLAVCEAIRELVLGGREVRMAPRTEAMLFAASRAEHVEKLILPALKRGDIVISDRFVDSSIAYQGVGRGLGVEWVKNLNQLITHDVVPDKTLLLVMKPHVVSQRIGARGDSTANHLDLLPSEFHDRICNQFLKMAQEEPDRFVSIDGSQGEKDVLNQVVVAVEQLLKRLSWSD